MLFNCTKNPPRPRSTVVSCLLIVLCGDVHTNPGPRPPKHPCGLCRKAVTNSFKAIQCDNCDLWIHNRCSGITDSVYQNFQNTSLTFFCLSCHMPTFLRKISSDIFETENRFEKLLPSANATILITRPENHSQVSTHLLNSDQLQSPHPHQRTITNNKKKLPKTSKLCQ